MYERACQACTKSSATPLKGPVRLYFVMAREMERVAGSARSIRLSDGGLRGIAASVQEVLWCNGEHSGL